MNLTLDTLNAMMAQIPPAPFFASSSLLPNDCAYKFQFEGREHIGAGPAFWDQFKKIEARHPDPSAITIWDLDADGNDERRKAFFRAMSIIIASGAGPIEDSIATAIERGYVPKPGAGITNPNPAG